MAGTPCRACHHPRPGDGGQASVITSRQALHISSSSCGVCDVLSRGITAVLALNEDGCSDAAAIGMADTDGDVDWLRIDFNRANARPSLDIHIFSSNTALSLFCPAKAAWPTLLLPDLPLGRHIPTSTASSESYAWARSKLLRCQALHKICRKVRDESLVRVQHEAAETRGGHDNVVGGPRRLIDIGETSGDSVHLVEMPGGGHDAIDSRYPYAALSHCWGREPFLRTLSSNIARHQRRGGIALARLPLTFREAIECTRGLGLRYLWIDSLCIVQDDPDDWQAESSHMAAIYQGAYLVISASKADGAHGGLYSDVAASPLYKTHVETIGIPTTVAGQHVGHLHDDASKADAPPALGEIAFRRAFAHMPSLMQRQLQTTTDLPTLARGWIYQERLLASRVLHFGPHELHWECMSESICQCRDNSADAQADDDAHRSSSAPTISTKPEYTAEHWENLNPHELTRSWHRLVETYSALRLTFPKDIFPALSGIAQTFQRVQKSAYLAGLWQSTIVPDLLWHATSTTPFAARSRVWRAPSWSWAATSNPIEYIETHDGVDAFCRIIEAAVQPAGRDATGELKAGYLMLEGYAFRSPMRLRAPPPEGGPDKYSAWNTVQVDALQRHVANVWADYNCFVEGDLLPADVLCFVLGASIPSGAFVMLLLREIVPADDAGKDGVYERIGIAQVSKPPSSPGSHGYWLQVFPSQQHVVMII